MDSEKTRQLDYISKIFSNLSTEKQENVLTTAKSLLQIQEQVPIKNKTTKENIQKQIKNQSK
jgi:hypothetical protein